MNNKSNINRDPAYRKHIKKYESLKNKLATLISESDPFNDFTFAYSTQFK